MPDKQTIPIAEVPEDLREEYANCCKYQNSGVVLCKKLIERISTLAHQLSQEKERNAAYRSALEAISAAHPCAGTYETVAHQKVLDALEFGRKATKHITDEEAQLGDGSERNLRLDAH